MTNSPNQPAVEDSPANAFAAWLIGAAGVVLLAGVCFVSGNELLGGLGYLMVISFLLCMCRWVHRLPRQPTDLGQQYRNKRV